MNIFKLGVILSLFGFSVAQAGIQSGIKCDSYYIYDSNNNEDDSKVTLPLKAKEDRRGYYLECDQKNLICPSATLRKKDWPGDITRPGFVLDISYYAEGKESGHVLSELWLDQVPSAGQTFQLRANLMDPNLEGYKYQDAKGRRIAWALLTCKVI